MNIDVSELTWFLGIMRVEKGVALPLIDLCRRAKEDKGFWLSRHGRWVPDSLSSLIYHETMANSIFTYEPIVVPGYLQTEDYARAVIGREDWRSVEELDASVALRLDRQQILDDQRGTSHVFFIHENALRTNVGGDQVMHEQMLALLLSSGAPNIALHVVPARQGLRSVFGGGFHYFEFSEHPPLVYLDGYVSGVFLEDTAFVEDYSRLLPRIAEIALDAEESRKFLVALADEHDRGSTAHAGNRVEEE